MKRTLIRWLATGAVAAAAAGVGVTAVSAATSSPSSTPGTSTAHHRHGLFRLPKVAGKVVSDSSTGGVAGKGVLVIQEPDGTQVTLNLLPHTHAWKYQGFGVKPVAESASSLSPGEIVVVVGRGVNSKNHWARTILDLGFQAAG
ncbi:MAG: hypothetical protein M0T72_12590 [Candidatus Dormibacteraeota bacterium]|nr:hypothetical protein [Candidatus Dormibacteraeota bacterium]